MPPLYPSVPSLSFLALGDSYTVGESVSYQECFPAQLMVLAKEKGMHLEDPLIIAKTGWTTSELLEGIKEKQLHRTFDVVTLLIGVNNQYRGLITEDYQKDFSTLLAAAIRFAGNKPKQVFVLSIPDWSVTPFARDRDSKKIAAEIDQFNAVNKGESFKAGVNYIDITTLSRNAYSDITLTASDGLHPSAKMYKIWCDEMLKFLIQ